MYKNYTLLIYLQKVLCIYLAIMVASLFCPHCSLVFTCQLKISNRASNTILGLGFSNDALGFLAF
jgi:hypothetical protein